jgi:uracil-DNA glycosylase family 4
MKTILYYRDGYFSVGFETPTNPWHRMMCQMLYGSSTKTITNEILNKFGIISLAYLYMDDGHRNKKNLCEIATCSFSPPEVDLLIDKINTIGIKSYRRPNSKYPRVYFDKPNSEKLCETIKDFVVPCMGYKLLPAFRGNFQNSVSNDKDIPFYDAFDLVERKDKTYNKVYCIDVDEFHNFITHSGVVHNCRPPGNRRPTEEESNNCRGYLDQQIQVVKPEWIVCWGATAGSNLLQQAKAGATQLRQKVFDYQGAKVICTYHPAYLLPHRKPEKKRDVWDDLQIVIKGLKDNEN